MLGHVLGARVRRSEALAEDVAELVAKGFLGERVVRLAQRRVALSLFRVVSRWLSLPLWWQIGRS